METRKIYTAINAVMNDIGAVGKNSKNQQQGFMFRGIDAVMNAINPALIKHKVFVVPEILEQTREERTNAKGTTLIYSICRVRYTFYAEDGSFVEAIVIGEGMDTVDKATNKAMSIAFKYACFQVFCIPTEEMVDPDAECHEVKATPKKPAEPKAKTLARPQPKMTAIPCCDRCGKEITPMPKPDGSEMPANAVYAFAMQRYRAPYCGNCMKELDQRK